LVEDHNVDSVLALVANRGYAGDQFKEAAAKSERDLNELGRKAKDAGKPLFMIRRFAPPVGMGEAPFVSYEGRLAEYPTAKRAARVLGHMLRRRQYLGD
jgi:hypothetical protein